MTQTLCRTCTHCKVVVSGKGSRFLLCQKAQTDDRFPKYPPQPVIRCDGYVEMKDRSEHPSQGDIP